MGKGDKKSKRGKIVLGTFGTRRRRKVTKKILPAALAPVEEKIEVKAEVKSPPKRKTKLLLHLNQRRKHFILRLFYSISGLKQLLVN